MKGDVSETIYVITAVVIGLFALTLLFISISDTGEVRALKAASSISFYANSLSTMEEGMAVINLGKGFNVKIVHIDDNVFEEVYKAVLFFIDFREEGKYIVVTPQSEGGDAEGSAYVLFSYPKDKSPDKDFGNPETICVIKRPERQAAEVEAC